MLQTIDGLTVETHEPDAPRRPHPLLLIHGMWEGAWIWQNFLPGFVEQGYVCHALNLRGHHGSKPVANIGKVSIRDYVADARTVASALGNPILIGHSMGGLVVQKLAEQASPPAAVAIAPAAPRGIWALNTWPLLRTALLHAASFLFWRPFMPSQAEMNQLLLNRLPPGEQERVYARLIPESGRQSFEITMLGLPVDAARVRCPLLVLGAADDEITPAKMVRKIARKYRAPYREYAGHAHMLMLEPGWEQVAADLRDWLDEHAPAQRATG